MRFIAALAVGCATTAAIGAVGAAPASAAVDCNLAGATLTVSMSADEDVARILRSGSNIMVQEGSAALACTGGAPTVTNTDLILVNDTSGQNTGVAIDSGFGSFAPGATDEAGTSDEIELQLVMGAGGADTLALVGSNFGDFWRLGDTAGAHGVNLNAGSETSGVVPGRDVDLEYFGVDGHLLINGSGSGDTVLANGGPEFTGPLTTPLDYLEEGGSGSDTIVGTDGDDIIEPGIGDDDVSGRDGDDRYLESGGEGDDDVDLGAAVDRYEWAGGGGPLRVDLRLSSRQDTGALGRDALTGIEDVFGSTSDDVLIGSDASNFLGGGRGDDLVQGLGGTLDVLVGGTEVDTLSYAGATSGVTVDLETADPQNTGGAGTDQLGQLESAFENLIGGPFADTLRGTSQLNRFEVRDGAADDVTCRGSGDTVFADVEGVDTIAADCETRQFDLRPDTQITSGPASLSADATPTFAFTSTKPSSTFECSLDGGAFGACVSPHTLAPVSDGAHQFAVHARDMLGALDLSPATLGFSVDTSTAATNAFGPKTLVTLALAAKRIPAREPLPVRVSNRNGFEVAGSLSGRTAGRAPVSKRKRARLASKRFRVEAGARKTLKLTLPKALRRRLERTRRLELRLTAKVNDPAGNTRTVSKTVKPKLRPRANGRR
jgi:hypothetical protein